MKDIPQIGIGLQRNLSLADWFPFAEQSVDLYEILLDNIMGPLDSPYVVQPEALDTLAPLRSKAVLLAHSNYGGEHGFGPLEHSSAVRRHVPIASMLGSPWVSNHCFYADNTWADIWSSPLQWSRAEVTRLAPRMRELQDLYGIPLLHENPAFYFPFPGNDLSDAEFLAALMDAAGTYLHLDLHNIYTNELNLPGYRCKDFLSTIPMDRVVAIHLAGGIYRDGVYHDSHNRQIPEPVWEMLEEVMSATRVRAVIFEYEGPWYYPDEEGPPQTFEEGLAVTLDVVTSELERAASLWDRIYGPQSRYSNRMARGA